MDSELLGKQEQVSSTIYEVNSNLKDEKISLVNSDEYSKPLLDHLARKKEILKRYFSNDLHVAEQVDNKSVIEAEMNMTFTKQDDNAAVIERLNKEIEDWKSKNEALQKSCDDSFNKLAELDSLNKELLGVIESTSTRNQELIDKHNALLSRVKVICIYASNLQRKYDLLSINYSRLRNEYSNQITGDLGKTISENSHTQRILNKEILFYKSELEKLKNVILNSETSRAYTKTVGSHAYSFNTYSSNRDTAAFEEDSKRGKLFEEYLQENKLLKARLNEHEKREMNCNRKWNELMTENKILREDTKHLSNQIHFQKEYFNNVIEDLDKKFSQSLERIPKLLSANKAEAAAYLIEQTNLLMEDKRKLINETVKLETIIKELKLSNDRLAADLNHHLNFVYGKDSKEKSLRSKIEELEDLTIQQKNLIEGNSSYLLEETIIKLNQIITTKDEEIKTLVSKISNYCQFANTRCNSKDENSSQALDSNLAIFDVNEILSSLTLHLKEREIENLRLQTQLIDITKKNQLMSYINVNQAASIGIPNVNSNTSTKSGFFKEVTQEEAIAGTLRQNFEVPLLSQQNAYSPLSTNRGQQLGSDVIFSDNNSSLYVNKVEQFA